MSKFNFTLAIFVFVLIWNTFTFTQLFSVTFRPVFAQISSLSSSSSSSSPSASHIGIKIDSPISGQEIPINSILRISGSSTDTPLIDCKALIIVNNIRPYKSVVPAEINDYSTWNFLLNSSYTSIKEGPDNKITARLECPPNLTKWYSVNVTGISSDQESLNRSLPSGSSSFQPSRLVSNFSSNADVPISILRAGATNNPLFNTSMINITSPKLGEQIPSGSEVTILGTSMDDFYSNCKVYAKRNDLPFQNTTAAGLTGSADYSVWKFTYTDKYGLITPGNTNNLTAKISCNENNKNLAFISGEEVPSYASIVLVGVNQPPVAAIHVDNQEVKEGEEIDLDGEDSNDPNGDSLTYLWKQTGGFQDGFDILNPTKPVAHFKVPDDLGKDTTLEFELVVTDNYGGESTEHISVEAASNTAPIADAGGDLRATRGEQIILDGSESRDPDPTGEIIFFHWESNGDNGAWLEDTNKPIATFSVPRVQDDTTFKIALTVIDDEGAKDEDTVEVEVEGNSKPVADAGKDQKAEIGEQVTLDGGGSHDPDPTGQIVSYDWEQIDGNPSVGLNDVSSSTPSFSVPINDKDTTYEFTLTVTDDEGATEDDKVRVKADAPSPPDLLKGPSEDQPEKLSASLPDEEEEEDQDEVKDKDGKKEEPRKTEDEAKKEDSIDLFSFLNGNFLK